MTIDPHVFCLHFAGYQFHWWHIPTGIGFAYGVICIVAAVQCWFFFRGPRG